MRHNNCHYFKDGNQTTLTITHMENKLLPLQIWKPNCDYRDENPAIVTITEMDTIVIITRMETQQL